MVEVLAHAGGHLFDSLVQLAVFLGPVPVIFYFLVRAVLQADDGDDQHALRESRDDPEPREERRDEPAPR